MANRSSPLATIRGTACGAASAATRNHSDSKRLRSTGASQSCATRKRGRARFTQSEPRAVSTCQISEDTPPESALANGTSLAPTSLLLRRKPRTGSGSEALNAPAAAFAPVEEPVVQPVGASLPELDLRRNEAIAAPVRRSGRLLRVFLFHLGHRFFQYLPVGDLFALGRCPRGEPGAERPAAIVGVGLLRRHFLDGSLDAHLPLEVRPEEHGARGGARGELLSFAAEVVGIEHESAALDAFQ